ncbi:putative ribonuclease H-like domain-containing protein [Tanacetum coccineum]
MKTLMSSDTKLTKDEECESVDSTKYQGMIEVMEFESAQSNTTAKLPILKLGEYEMWVIRIKQYFQVQDYALWEVSTSVTKMSVPVTAEEKTNKKNDVKARSLLLMALPNEHQLTFSQYNDAKTMFAAIETRFGGNEATKKTQKTLLAILGVVITQEDLNSKFLRSLPPEWNTHVVVWMNKADIETMSIDDLYNNFKIVEQDVKKSVGASSGAQNLAFMTAPSTSSTNDVNTANPAYEVSTVSPNINTACPQVSTANFSDNTVYAFMVENPNGSNLLQQDLEQIHEDDLEAMDLKWQLSLLSMRAKRYFQRTGKKIFINANDTAGYDKSKVECFNCHKMGYFAKECRAPRTKEGQFRYQDNTRKQGNNEDTSSKAMLSIDGVAATYKRGLATVEEQLVTYRKNEVLFSKEVAVLKREVACKDYEINMLKSEFEKVKQEKEGIEFKIEKFDNASKSLDKLLGSQITDKSKKGLGYNVVPPPHPLIYNRPKKLDLSNSGFDEFKDPEFKSYGSKDSKLESNIVCDTKSDDSKENSDDSLIEFIKPKNHEKPVKKSVRYDNTAMRYYHTERPRAVNIARSYTAPVNVVRAKRVNAVKTSACWGWRPTRPNSASLGKCYKRPQHVGGFARATRPNGGSHFQLANLYENILAMYVTMSLITLDNLGKFDGKSDEGFFVGYSLSSKAFRVYNTRTRRVEENLHIGFLENNPMIEGNSPKWLFDIHSLTQSMNYVPVAAGTISNESAG